MGLASHRRVPFSLGQDKEKGLGYVVVVVVDCIVTFPLIKARKLYTIKASSQALVVCGSLFLIPI